MILGQIRKLDHNEHQLTLRTGTTELARVTVRTSDTEAYIEDLNTTPRYRRKGYATELLAALTQWELTRNCDQTLMVLESNEEAIRLYRRAGFIAVERVPHMTALDEHMLIMRRFPNPMPLTIPFYGARGQIMIEVKVFA